MAKKSEMSPEAYERHKQDMRERMAEKVAAGQEIGPLPAIVDPARRLGCEYNLQRFAETYVRGLFKGCKKRWATFHVDAFRRLQQAILYGGRFVIACPRGSGKSAVIKAAKLWAGVYGHSHFAVVVCASNVLSIQFLRSLKKQLNGSRKLFEDFPEICHCIRALENKAQKANGQVLNGQRTAIEWGFQHIVFPTVPGYKSSGFKVATSGITGSGLRGLVDAKEADEEGDVDEERVDFVSIDDFQTRGSAKSEKQTNTRLEIIRGDILGMAGPGEKFTVAAAVTVIKPNDGADQLLDDPAWIGIRHGLLTDLPVNMVKWGEYKDVKDDAVLRGLGVGPQNEFYLKHRAELELGCQPTWEDRFNPESEVSAIQAAMNLYFEVKAAAFYAEYMNSPQITESGGLFRLDPKILVERLSGLPEGQVPLDCHLLTIGVDIQLPIMFYWVNAWGNGFSGSAIKFGTIPDQRGRYFSDLSDLTCTLQSESGADPSDIEAAVWWGLQELGRTVLSSEYQREDGTPLKIKRGHIDINWQPSESAVARFCRLSDWKEVCSPSRGQGITTTKRRISAWKEQPGERHPPKSLKEQCQWMFTPPKKHLNQECYHLKSHWHGRAITMLSKPVNSRGSVSLSGKCSSPLHQMVAEHLTAHYPVEKKIGIEEFIHYEPKPGRTRWDFLDCFINASVAASVEGIQLEAEAEVREATAAKKKKRKYIEIPDHMKPR